LSAPEITTLIEDVYGLFKGHECDPKRVEEFGHSLAQIVSSRLAENREGQKPNLRLSAIGKPPRALWYDLNDSELAEDARRSAEPLEPYVRLKFLTGDLWEAVLLFLAKEAGHTVEQEQATVELNGVVGHIDAIIDGVVVDVKSASTRSFEKFKTGELRNDDGFGYMEQISGYSLSLGGLPGAFFAGDKTLGHLALMQMDSAELANIQPVERIDYLRGVIASPEPPERCYSPKIEGSKNYKTGGFSPNGNLSLSTGCSYCKFKQTCWSDSNGGLGLRGYVYSSGIKWFTHIESEPKVMEVTF
jgi:hypothetical protein